MSGLELVDKNCLLYDKLDILGKKWMIFFILEMAKDVNASYRYRDFEKVLPGVTSRSIAMRLDELVKAGLIDKEKFIFKGVITKYKLTKAGAELVPIIENLQLWGNKFFICEPKEKENCSRCDMFKICKKNKI